MINFYLQRGRRCQIVGKAFARGFEGTKIHGPVTELFEGPAAFYGVLPDNLYVWKLCQASERKYYYLDNAYFGSGHTSQHPLRVTINQMQHPGIGAKTKKNEEKFKAYGIDIKHWDKSGRHILIAAQSEWWYQRHGTTLSDWVNGVIKQITNYTERPIRVRLKPKHKLKRPPNFFYPSELTAAYDGVPLAQDLEDAWAVIAHSSNVAVDAIMAGIPAFVTYDCAAKRMSSTNLSMIEHPFYPENRYGWGCVLAGNQWLLDEIRDGTCKKELRAWAS